MTASALPTTFLKWVVTVLLGLMLSGGVAMVYWSPVHAYRVACKKAQEISCVFERERASGLNSWQMPLGAQAAAVVRVEPRRRGPDRVFLFLQSGSHAVFAAEFEGSAAVAEAEAARAKLNRVFSSEGPAFARIEARQASYLLWLTWGFLGFLGLLVLAIFRELYKPEHGPGNSSRTTPGSGAA